MSRGINFRVAVENGRSVFQVYCPICRKPKTLQQDKRHPDRTAIGLHMIDAHGGDKGGIMEFVTSALEIVRREKNERKLKAAQEAEDARVTAEAARKERCAFLDRRAKSCITLTSSEVDEIQEELSSLISMMEPYYSQGNCYRDAQALIEKLETKIANSVMEAAQ